MKSIRSDQRLNNQLRSLTFTPNFTNYAEGRVLIETGQTRVLCTASISETIPRWREACGAWSNWPAVASRNCWPDRHRFCRIYNP